MRQEVLDALSNHIIDPERISFMQPFLSCTSQGSFGDVLRGALIPFPDDTCPSKVPAETIPVAVKILRTGDNIPTSMLQRVSYTCAFGSSNNKSVKHINDYPPEA